jgi:cytochrome b subunit of formate dehydrogenase
MIEFTIIISLFVGLLFFILLLACFLKWEKIRLFLSCTVSALSFVSMILFYNMQKASGNPDQGMEFWQWYLPLSIYLFLTMFGIIFFIKSYKKLKS